jgi:hypothetical protein
MTDRHEPFRLVHGAEERLIADGRRPANIASDRPSARRRLEVAARAELELRAGRCFSDAEWAEARSRLVEYGRILTDWHQQKRTNSPQLSVEIPADEMLPKAA